MAGRLLHAGVTRGAGGRARRFPAQLGMGMTHEPWYRVIRFEGIDLPPAAIAIDHLGLHDNLPEMWTKPACGYGDLRDVVRGCGRRSIQTSPCVSTQG
jgi:hypothetical protein